MGAVDILRHTPKGGGVQQNVTNLGQIRPILRDWVGMVENSKEIA